MRQLLDADDVFYHAGQTACFLCKDTFVSAIPSHWVRGIYTELHDDTYVYHNACERYAF